MLWYLNPTNIHLQRARALTQTERVTPPRGLPALPLRVPVLKTQHAKMVSSILFSQVGGGAGPHLAVHLLATTGPTQILLHRAGQATLGIICPVVGMKILIEWMFECSLYYHSPCNSVLSACQLYRLLANGYVISLCHSIVWYFNPDLIA
jgi:hypothetical protein